MKIANQEMFILHIRDAIREIEKFTLGKERVDFEFDSQLASAVAYQIMIIGEASGHLTPEAVAEMPEIPWKDVIGTRHKVVHDYFGVDLGVIWDIVHDKLPLLKTVIDTYIASHPEVQKMDAEVAQ